MQDELIRELVDRAAKECGTKAELARQLGVSATRLNEWRGGHRACPPEQVAIIADIAGMPAEQWLVRATLLNSKGKPYEERLHRALGKWLPRTGAAIGLYLLTAALTVIPAGNEAQATEPGLVSTMYIMLNAKRVSFP